VTFINKVITRKGEYKMGLAILIISILLAIVLHKQNKLDAKYITKLQSDNKLLTSKLQLLQYAKEFRNAQQ